MVIFVFPNIPCYPWCCHTKLSKHFWSEILNYSVRNASVGVHMLDMIAVNRSDKELGFERDGSPASGWVESTPVISYQVAGCFFRSMVGKLAELFAI